MSGRGWIGCDLDGTLARYESKQGVGFVGEPIPRMVERVKAWLAAGETVKILTARTCGYWGEEDRLQQVTMIQAWCEKYLGQALEVTSVKDFAMTELWDDRAIGVVKNEGVRQDELAQAIGRLEPMGYDRAHGQKWDPYADYQPEQRYEKHGLPNHPNDRTIGVHGSSVDVGSNYTRSAFYVTAREARVLAATLLRAACDAEMPESFCEDER